MNKSTHTCCTIVLSIFALSSFLSVSNAAIRVPAPGDLVISEVMSNPSAVSDSVGEWFELFNPTIDSLILESLIISDNGSNTHQINSGGNLLIESGQYLVLGRNNDINFNGGIITDYIYSGFTLGNTADAIIISSNDIEITRLEYSAGFSASGRSTELSSELGTYQLTPDNFTYGAGDIGTPGSAGSSGLTVSAVPIPAAMWLFASGLVGFCSIARKNRD